MMMRSVPILCALLLLAGCGDTQTETSHVNQHMEHTQGIAVQAGGDATVTVNNYQRSADWQALLKKRDELQAALKESPNVPYLHKKLAEVQQHMEDFKRDVLKLAEEINKIPLNTARLKQAVAYFDAGEYDKARAVLDAAAITQEQDALLQRQRELQSQQAEIRQQLDNKAEEFLLKARLTAIDYSLGDQRIATTSHYFEQALKSGRTPERLFSYAVFLQKNNQRKEAETFYTEALDSYRTLAKTNPDVYLPYVARTLGGFGYAYLQWGEPQQARIHLQEAAAIMQPLAKQYPSVYGGLYDFIIKMLAETE